MLSFNLYYSRSYHAPETPSNSGEGVPKGKSRSRSGGSGGMSTILLFCFKKMKHFKLLFDWMRQAAPNIQPIHRKETYQSFSRWLFVLVHWLLQTWHPKLFFLQLEALGIKSQQKVTSFFESSERLLCVNATLVTLALVQRAAICILKIVGGGTPQFAVGSRQRLFYRLKIWVWGDRQSIILSSSKVIVRFVSNMGLSALFDSNVPRFTFLYGMIFSMQFAVVGALMLHHRELCSLIRKRKATMLYVRRWIFRSFYSCFRLTVFPHSLAGTQGGHHVSAQ